MHIAKIVPTLILLVFLYFPPLSARILNVPEDHETIQAGIDAAEDGMLAGAGFWVDNESLRLGAWGDDPGTEAVEGFIGDKQFSFRAWDSGENREYDVFAFFLEGPETWTEDAVTVLNLESFSHLGEVLVSFREGWNMISINVMPPHVSKFLPPL